MTVKRSALSTQRHHISYEPEEVVTVYQGEHWILSQLGRRVNVSQGMLQSLEHYVTTHRFIAVDLGKPTLKRQSAHKKGAR